MRNTKTRVITVVVISTLITLLSYTIFGTASNVEEIKKRAPAVMLERGWELMRYEGWQRGSWHNNGGKVWYHVRDIDNHQIQYRVFVVLWADELHWVYGDPIPLKRFDIKI